MASVIDGLNWDSRHGLFAVLFTRRKQQEDATKTTTSDDQLFDEVEKLKSDWQEHKKK